MFEEIQKGLYLLKVPFGDAWTGVTFIDGKEKVLVDTGSKGTDIDEYIEPALKQLGVQLSDLTWLCNTHSHGDHIGGYQRIKERCPNLKVAAAESDAHNVEDPASLAVKIRTRFPANSPAPQCYLKGVKVDRILKDGESLTERLTVYQTPGHDGGCVCWYDKETKTIICGDSVQGNGAGTQGIAFYQSLDDYRNSMKKLQKLDIENILCGHDYDRIGSMICGKENVQKTLQYCLDVTDKYQTYIEEKISKGIADPVEIAKDMINDIGCGMPPMLFMALYTVNQHISKIQ